MPEGGQTLQHLSLRLQHVVGKQQVVRKDAPKLLSSHFAFSDILEPLKNNHQGTESLVLLWHFKKELSFKKEILL